LEIVALAESRVVDGVGDVVVQHYVTCVDLEIHCSHGLDVVLLLRVEFDAFAALDLGIVHAIQLLHVLAPVVVALVANVEVIVDACGEVVLVETLVVRILEHKQAGEHANYQYKVQQNVDCESRVRRMIDVFLLFIQHLLVLVKRVLLPVEIVKDVV